MLSAPFTVLAKLAVLQTSNIPNSYVDCSKNTWASLLTGSDLSLTCKHMVVVQCNLIIFFSLFSVSGFILTLLIWMQPMLAGTVKPLPEVITEDHSIALLQHLYKNQLN